MKKRQVKKQLKKVANLIEQRKFHLVTVKQDDFLRNVVTAYHQSRYDKEFAPKLGDYFAEGTFKEKVGEFFRDVQNTFIGKSGMTVKNVTDYTKYQLSWQSEGDQK